MVLTRQNKRKQADNLISATKISNSVKNDKLLDYLDILDSNDLYVSKNLTICKKRSRSLDHLEDKTIDIPNKKKKSSFDYIVEEGYLFETDIINKIKQMMKINNQLNKLIEINEINKDLNVIKTIQIIKKNFHSIIIGSIVINSIDNTWGKPDLIVKGCWIEKYIRDNVVGLNVNKWYIIDIKSSTIQLINGGEDISSKLLYSVYKSQVYIYTQALNNSLKDYGIYNDVNMGFILGKKYKYALNKKQIIKNKNSFDCLGIIDFDKEKSKGIDWNKIVKSSIEWINNLKTNWKEFTLNPINRDELYPNMKNAYNKNWYEIKKNVAYINKEITSLWFCGIDNREKAWEYSIKSYMDPNLTPEILGFVKSDSKYFIIDQMLKLLHNDKINYIINKKNNLMNWQNKCKWEFFIDFETFNSDNARDSNDVGWDGINEWDNIYTGNQKIYMCGISWIDPKTLSLVHKYFVIKYPNSQNLKEEFNIENIMNENIVNNNKPEINLDDYIECTDELDLIKKIFNFIDEFRPSNVTKNEYFNQTRLIHWSCAEPILYNKKLNEYQLDYDKYKLNWYDLLKIFKHPQYPIIIKECFGFGLKAIVKKLNELGEIDINWPSLDDGLLSSFIARDIYSNKCTEPNKQMYSIIKYNLIDCKAMWELIEWMRKNIVKKRKFVHYN